jgi:hypothetical protein
MRLPRRGCSPVRTAWVAASVTLTVPLMAQSAPPRALANWTGSIRCEIQSRATGYAHQETQTWTLAGPPTVQGSVTVYPATWSVTGQGWHDRTRNTNRRVAQWTVDVPGQNSPRRAAIGFTRHAVGGGFDVGRRNAQLTSGGGYAGPERYIHDGVVQQPTRLAGTVYEWQFSKIEAAASQQQLVGATSAEVKAFVGPLQPSDAVSTVTCAWALGQGSAPPLPPPTMSPLSTPASVALGGSAPPAIQTAPTGATSAGSSVAAGTPPAGSSMIAGGALATGAGVVGSQPVALCATAPFPQYVANPGGVTLDFSPSPGILGWRVARGDLGDLTPVPIAAPSYTHAAPLEYFSTYQYVVTGVRADGSCTTSGAKITPPKPLTPQVGARVVASAPTNRVTLSWGTQADRPTGYLVLGAGLPQDGIEVPASTSATGQSLDTGNLPIGTHAWLVTPFWKTPAGTMIDVSTGARVTATVGVTAGAVVPGSIWDALTKAAEAYKAMLSGAATVPR